MKLLPYEVVIVCISTAFMVLIIGGLYWGWWGL